MNMKNGWIAVHRKILDNPILNRSRKFSNFEAWMYLLLKSNHKDNKVLLGNVLVNVKKGEMITSLNKLSSRFKWSNTKLRAFLKLIESEQMIVVKSDTQKTQITICNYDKLQINENNKKISKTHQKHIKNTQTTMYNNVNNNNTSIVDRKKIFINKVLAEGIKRRPMVDPETIKAFTNHWTEHNEGGRKMKWEKEGTFQIANRLNTWLKNEIRFGIKSNSAEYKADLTGNSVNGYCSVCGKHEFYSPKTVKSEDSKCKNHVGSVLPKKPKFHVNPK